MLKQKHLTCFGDRMGKTPQVMGIIKDFLNRTSFPQEMVPTISKWDCSKLNLCTEKRNNGQSEKKTYRMKKKLYQPFLRDTISSIHKNSKKLDPPNQIKDSIKK